MLLHIRRWSGRIIIIEVDRPPHVTHGTLVWVIGTHQHFLAAGSWTEAWTEDIPRA